MSLILNNKSTPHIEIKTHGFEDEELNIFIEEKAKPGYVGIRGEISGSDMFQLIKYYMTNTNLKENDIRFLIQSWVQDLIMVEGYGGHNKKYQNKNGI